MKRSRPQVNAQQPARGQLKRRSKCQCHAKVPGCSGKSGTPRVPANFVVTAERSRFSFFAKALPDMGLALKIDIVNLVPYWPPAPFCKGFFPKADHLMLRQRAPGTWWSSSNESRRPAVACGRIVAPARRFAGEKGVLMATSCEINGGRVLADSKPAVKLTYRRAGISFA